MKNSILNFTVMRKELFNLKIHGLYEKITSISMKIFLETPPSSHESHQVDRTVVQLSRDIGIVRNSLRDMACQLLLSR